ncbi:Ribonuclease E inhibitor RraA/Dimethylmenaquinone methyltransferase [Moorella glycerini]|uniref:Putative 4-hydroxy-4-methyl-2-oxoglutarate aldolase n=1 Tax=Neomoorella stamsii TaxID=1266720 RepID=A0A9X7J0S8_9FIRM|nr:MULTISPECIES: 4-carboxy-4-hydroxy-2-oxoadipate aldolase/oxaloacetate decarboxylase [Moorella]PRR70054.1 4-hydroxy-4-methyl-2-oxoglutarate aldolase [Moorella stamsii]CEP66124.1 Ribonuclease E inhibitor RraA/Dimethylmenaquinone methyltransferase [Moorella glycerini]
MVLTPEEILQFLKLPTGNICDANGKGGNMDPAIKPIDPKSKMAGTAVTVRCQPGDNLTLHQAIYEAEPGSVLVIDVHAYTGAGPFGEIMAIACLERGIAGVVIDGACRDANDIQELGLPLFCRAFNPGGTVKESLGTINEIIQCGGVVVKPGDIVVGDCDGVVVVPQERAREVLERAQAIAAKEKEVRELLRQGKTTLEIYGFDKLIEKKKFK